MKKASTIRNVITTIEISHLNENRTITASTYYNIRHFRSQKGKRDTQKHFHNITDLINSNQSNLEDYQNKSVLIVGFFCAMRIHEIYALSR